MYESRALVLNASYEPIQIVSVERALKLVLLAKAEIVEAGVGQIRSWLTTVARPSVIRLLRYVVLPHRQAPCTRRGVLLRDNFTCQYCGTSPAQHLLTLDHVVPRALGGKTTWENVVTACKSCNHAKGSRTLQEARMTLRAAPQAPSSISMMMRTLGRHPTWQAYSYR
jgi:5-methylcytosine-specific restriction endonuclease McrA